jgi:hypothetical protein
VPPIARSLAIQSFLYAVGNGVFLTGSAVFFVHVVGLTPTQVGVGLSVAGGLTLLLAVPMGKMTDRVGAQRVWVVSSVVEAALFCAYPFVRGFWPFLAVVGALALAGSGSNSGRGVYTIEAVATEERVRVLAFARSALNAGFAIGTLLAGVALSVDTVAAYDAMVLANAAGLLLSATWVSRMPKVPKAVAVPTAPRALKDRPFLAVTAVCSVLLLNATLQTELLPLWTVTQTDAPRPVLSAVFFINTVLVVALQVRAARGTDTARLLRWGGLASAAALPALWLSGATSSVTTIALIVLAGVLITAGELWQSAGAWGVTTLLPPPGRRGEYLGAFKLGTAAQSMAGPALLTWLAIGTGGWGWLVIAGLFVVGSTLAKPAVDHALTYRSSRV